MLSSVSPDLPLDVSPQEFPQSPEVYRMSRFPMITSHVCQYQVARPRFPRLVSSHSVILCPWLCPDNVSLLLLKSPSECLQSRYLMLLSVVHRQVSLARKVSLPLSPPPCLTLSHTLGVSLKFLLQVYVQVLSYLPNQVARV